jgi:polar amino acid transport system substrate-binding protein
MRTLISTRWLAALALSLATAVSPAQVGNDAAARDALAPTGTLRAVFLATNPMQGRVDAETREVTGPAADIVRELAGRLGVPAAIEPVPGVPAVIEAVRNASADIGFLAYDATRAEQVAFTQAYILGHNSYIVRADSPIRTLAEADRAGVRIGARDGVAVDLFLSRTLQSATLLHLPRETTEAQATRLVLTGEIDAYAANTERLAIAAAIEPRIRVVDGSLVDAEQAIVVTLGNEAGVAFLDRFLDEARTSGFLQSLVERHELAGVSVAPKATR